MNDIEVDRAAMADLLNKFEDSFDGVRSALDASPAPADAGEASNEIGVVVTALAELAEKAMIAGTGLRTVALGTVDNLLAGDSDAADVFTRIGKRDFS